MVRRTKAQAEETRQRLLDAAEEVFSHKGVSGSTLDDVARNAGTTRGAIHHHFKDKVGLLDALQQRASAPIGALIEKQVADSAALPLTVLVAVMTEPFKALTIDPHLRRVVAITSQMMEYTPEFSSVRSRNAATQRGAALTFQKALTKAARAHEVELTVNAAVAGRVLSALFFGLIHGWTLEPESFDLRKTARAALQTHLRGLGFDEATLALYGLHSRTGPARK